MSFVLFSSSVSPSCAHSGLCFLDNPSSPILLMPSRLPFLYLSLHSTFLDLCLFFLCNWKLFPLTFYNTFMSGSASCFLDELAVFLPPSNSKVLAHMLWKATVPSPKITALCFPSFLYLSLQQPHLSLRCSSLFLSALSIKIEPVSFCSSLQTQ